MSGRHPPVPHSTFGVIVVKEVPQVDPLHLEACLKDPGAENRGEFLYLFVLMGSAKWVFRPF